MKAKKDSLDRAMDIIAAVSRLGFQWDDLRGPLAKAEEEWGELKQEILAKRRSARRMEAELGDYLFSLCNIAYFLGLSPKRGLSQMLKRFERRFAYVEKQVRKSKRPWKDFSLQELDVFWEEAKRLERCRAK